MEFSSRLARGLTVTRTPVLMVALAALATGACSSSTSGGGASPSETVPGSTAGGSTSGGTGSADGGTTSSGSEAGATGDGGSGGSSTRDAATTPPCKRGITYYNENAADAPALKGTVGWWYDGAATPDAAATTALQDAGLEYVPMIGSGPPNGTIDVTGLIASIPSSAKYLLAFQAPNIDVGGYSLTPAQAAADWPQLEQIAKARNLKLVAPTVGDSGGNFSQTDPFVWLDAFLAACSGCQVDSVAFRPDDCDVGTLTRTLGRFKAYGKPVWLTGLSCAQGELGSDTSLPAQQAYMQAAIPVLEADPSVFRYAWSIGRSSSPAPYDILAGPGSLSALGTTYRSLAGACP